MKIKVTTVPYCLREGDKVRYRIVVRHNGRVGEETFTNRVARRCGYDEAVVGCILGGCKSQLREELANGNCVNLGWLYAYDTAQGSAESIREPWNPAKHRLVGNLLAKGPLKTCLEDAEVVNVTDGPKVVILHVADTVAQIDGTISGTGAVDVFITGTGLAVDLVSAEEGVWLQDGEDVVQAVATVTEATSTTLACRFASLPSDGTYTLVVASRDGQGASAGVSMGKCKVTVRAVATDEEAEP